MGSELLQGYTMATRARAWVGQFIFASRREVGAQAGTMQRRPHAPEADGGSWVADWPAVTRVAYYGDLIPQGCAMDLLSCAIDWADRHPSGGLEVWWIGEGALRGILAAQPTPANLSQRFRGGWTGELQAEIVPSVDVVVAADRSAASIQAVRTALAANAALIGRRDGPDVEWLKAEGREAWLFDERRPASLMSALSNALNARRDAGCRHRLQPVGADARRATMADEVMYPPLQIEAASLSS